MITNRPGVSSVASRRERLCLLAVVAAFATLSIVYNVDVPAGEGVDEVSHLEYTLYLKERHTPPVLSFVARPDTVLMGYHPPLYYILAALIVTPIDTGNLNQALPPNPHFVWIEGTGPGNRNVFLHSPVTGGDPFPYVGVILAIHLLRLFSTAQGIAALFVAHAILRRLAAGRPGLALLGTAATAFQPAFVEAYSVAQNDGLVALFILFGTLWCIWLVESARAEKTWSSGVIGGATLGLALLTKETTLALGPVLAVALALVALRTREYRRVLAMAVVVGGLAVLLAGGWYLRNLVLYGNLLAQNVYAALYASFVHQGPYTWGDFVAFVQQLRRNYWGAFGYEHVLFDQRVVDALWVVAAIALPGLIWELTRLWRDQLRRSAWIIAGSAVAWFTVLFVKWSTISGGGAAHGRFFVAIMPVVNVGIVLGLARLVPMRRPVGSVAFVGALAAMASLAPSQVILPAYRPPLVAGAELNTARALDLTFGDQLRLVGTRLGNATVRPGAATELTLYWQRPAESAADPRFRVRLVARDGTVILDKQYWPAGGGVPPYTWPAGSTYRDVVPLPVPSNATTGLARILLSVQASNAAPVDQNRPAEEELGRVAIADVSTVPSLPPAAEPVGATFAGGIDLVGYRDSGTLDPGGPYDVSLYWRTPEPVDDDATVSLQVLDPAGRLVAQDDSEPDRGRAPTTTWPVDRVVVDSRQVRLPAGLSPGSYQLIVALYTRPSLARLPVVAGAPPGDHLLLATLPSP